MGGVNVVLNEAANSPDQGVTVDQQNIDGMETVIVNLVDKSVATNGPVGRVIGSTYGVHRSVRRS